MIQASRFYKLYWIWLIFTSPNEYLLDRVLGLVANGTDCFQHKQKGLVEKVKKYKFILCYVVTFDEKSLVIFHKVIWGTKFVLLN